MIYTLNVPRLQFVEIDVANDIEVDLLVGDLLAEVVLEKLLFSGVESEARRDLRLAIH